jgi:putative Mg2+ transporter-C (MgtC) family protein
MSPSRPEFLADPVYLEISIRLFAALFVGGLIGLERSFHGRPAGFRTHALVCLSTSLLMLITAYETRWFPGLSQGRISLDPTRMAQGIMTGIGFLGAGTIMREGLSVRGLTTAASLWITAAIGILVGIGFFFPAVLATVLTLGTLSLFRWIEARIPAEFYAHFTVRFARDRALPEPEMRRMLKEHGFTIGSMSYRLDLGADFFEYRMIIRSNRSENARKFADALSKLETVKEFRVVPTGA